MKVLMMHRGDGDAGGGQVQMNRLHAGLREQGVEARILCREKVLEDSVLMPFRSRTERLLGKVTRRLGLNDIHLVSSFDVTRSDAFTEADLIDIHCLHSGTFSYLALPALTARKPVVFTFHDMWPLTGHCHASLECDRWMTGCGACPHPEIEPVVERDATAIEWWLKKRAYDRSNFTIVAPSQWLCDRIKVSMLGGFPVHHIPHGVETDVFRPLDKARCRAELEIPEGKNVLLCAMENMRRPLKGAELLVEALEHLPGSIKRDSVLLLFGHSSPEITSRITLPVIDLGYLHDNTLKASAFAAADLLINPSRAESFGLVPLESMACGTPVVCFRVGALPELIRPGVTGFLADPDDAEELAAGVVRLLADRGLLAEMSARCRQIALMEYTLERQVRRYVDVYQEVLLGASRKAPIF